SGSNTFSGIFQMEGMSVDEQIDCDTVVTVATPSEQNVCRDLPAGTQAPGSMVTVSLETTVGSASFYVIDEMIPAGCMVTGASDDGDFTSTPGHVYWVVTSGATDTTYTYTVMIPGYASDGTYTFNGIFQMEGMSSSETISCDTTITVSSVPVALATRTLPATVLRGDTFTVGMSVADYGASGTVMEMLPDGFTYDDSTLDPTEVMVDGNMVTFNLTGETSFEYTVMASMMEGDYTFSGMITDEEANEYPVGGDTSIEVLLPDGIVLHPGWNYISVPYVLADPSVASVLEGVTYDALTYYNAETETWDTVSTIEPLKAYWINISEAVITQIILEENLDPMMPASPSFIMVYAGWNAIGYTDSTDTLSAELTLASIDDSYTTIVGPWNPATMMYVCVGHNNVMGPISGKHVGTDVFEMNPYEGYWVYATEDGVLNSIGM
ncbi:MAG: hypothetical protein JXA98_09315, partial [Methanosarcinaceae archaeon]|nr:hypothetical protein [Methanosarcinaceae archaeon]